MPIYTARLVVAERVTGANHDLFTTPPGKTAIIKNVALSLSSGGARTIALAIRLGGSSQFISIISRDGVTPAMLPQLERGLHVVLPAGDTLLVFTSGPGDATVRVGAWGSLLSGVVAV